MDSRLTFKALPLQGRAGIALALVTAAFIGALGFAFYFGGRQIEHYTYAGALAFAAFAITALANSSVRFTIGPPGCLFIAFVAWNALSTTWSSVPYTSLIDLGMLAPGLGAYLVWRVWNTDQSTLPTEFLMLALGLGFSALLGAQLYMGYRPQAMFLNPNSAAGFLNFTWPFAAAAWLDHKGTYAYRLFALGSVFVIVSALSLDGSRGAMLGAFAGLTAITILSLYVLRNRGSIFLLITAFTVALIGSNTLGSGAVSSGVASLGSPTTADAGRFTIWQPAWEMVMQQPWLGYGPGVFWQAYSAYRSPGEGSSGFWVHNDYLEFWLETGVLGLILVLALAVACAAVAVSALRRYRADRLERGDITLASACLSGIIAVACHSFFTFNLQLMSFIMVFGIMLAELERGCGNPAWFRPRIPSFRRVLPMIGLAALSILVVGHYARTAVALTYADDGVRLMRERSYVEAANAFAKSQGIWAQIDSAWYHNADVLLQAMRGRDIPDEKRAELVGQASKMLDRAEYYNPHRADTPLIRGLLWANHPDLTNGPAKDQLYRAIELNPREIESYYALSQLFEREGNLKEARAILERGLRVARHGRVNGAPLARRLHVLRASASSQTDISGGEAIRRPTSKPLVGTPERH